MTTADGFTPKRIPTEPREWPTFVDFIGRKHITEDCRDHRGGDRHACPGCWEFYEASRDLAIERELKTLG